jgi:hypothetical protein
MTAAAEAKISTRAGEPTGAGLVIMRGRHQDTVRCGCGDAFLRPKGETYVTCLGCQTAYRLALAGVGTDDPALRRIAVHTAKVFASSSRRAANVQGVRR